MPTIRLREFRISLKVLRNGCHFLLTGSINEAERGEYLGLHQWNFDVKNGSLILWRPGIRINVSEALVKECLLVEAKGDDWYWVIFRRL